MCGERELKCLQKRDMNTESWGFPVWSTFTDGLCSWLYQDACSCVCVHVCVRDNAYLYTFGMFLHSSLSLSPLFLSLCVCVCVCVWGGEGGSIRDSLWCA